MNLVLETIRRRRSSRRYLPDPVAPQMIEAILDAAVWTPSSMNGQPWHFTVVDDSLILDAISQKSNQVRAASGMAHDVLSFDDDPPDSHLFYKAPLVIIVSGRQDTLSANPNVDCALAAYSMSLAAASLGLANCIIDLYNSFGKLPEAPEMLNLSNDYMPYYGVALGHRDERLAPMSPIRKSGTVSFFGSRS